MRRSLKKQIALMFTGVIALLLVGLLLINGNFLERYYILNKTGELTAMYETVSDSIDNGSLSGSQTVSYLNTLAERTNIAALILDGGGDVVYMTARETNGLLLSQLMGYLLGQNQDSGKLLERGDTYEIRQATDPVNKAEYIEMWGTLEGDELFIFRSPMVSIQENAALANRFLLYVGLALTVFGVLLAEFLSNRITGPIKRLTELSRRMARLDFGAKYTGREKNEISVLGESFNSMSETLEKTITELKQANNSLKKDIARKEETERMRTEFLGNVSHELKTPIALIQGYAEGLKEGLGEDPENREFYCDVIVDEAEKMNRMVQNLLVLNQLEFGADQVEISRFDLVSLIQGVLQSLEILLQQAQIQVTFSWTEPFCVWADEIKTEQVLRNYLTNAIHHAGAEKRVEIRLEPKEDVVRVSVFNSGDPIPQEELDRIWDKFYKVDKAHTREYGGNGIGLSIVRAIMESMHQRYGVQNYDNGVAFWFELDARSDVGR